MAAWLIKLIVFIAGTIIASVLIRKAPQFNITSSDVDALAYVVKAGKMKNRIKLVYLFGGILAIILTAFGDVFSGATVLHIITLIIEIITLSAMIFLAVSAKVLVKVSGLELKRIFNIGYFFAVNVIVIIVFIALTVLMQIL